MSPSSSLPVDKVNQEEMARGRIEGKGSRVAQDRLRAAACRTAFGNTLGLLDMTKGPLPQGLGLSSEESPKDDMPNTNG